MRERENRKYEHRTIEGRWLQLADDPGAITGAVLEPFRIIESFVYFVYFVVKSLRLLF